MSLQKSVERLKNSRIEQDAYGFHLSDIEGLFYAYNEMSDEDKEGGMLTVVLGRDKKGLGNAHLMLRPKEGDPVYTGNVSHPCPPWAIDHCMGG